MRHVFNLRTFVIKFLSCCLGVGAGLPAGPEGPMIHIGLMAMLCSNLNSMHTIVTTQIYSRIYIHSCRNTQLNQHTYIYIWSMPYAYHYTRIHSSPYTHHLTRTRTHVLTHAYQTHTPLDQHTRLNQTNIYTI